MRRATTTVDLRDGRRALVSMTRECILVAVDDRACLAHRDWFDRAIAREMIRTLSAFVESSSMKQEIEET